MICETVQALGYHHLGDLYTPDHRVARERALKERAQTRKGIPGHSAILVPLLRVPTPRWQAAPKDWIPGGRVAKTSKEEIVYNRGCAVKVSTAMKDTMEAEY